MDANVRPMLPTAALDYELPPELIATEPAHPRDAARLMVISRGSGKILAHDIFRNIGSWLRPGDLLVVNATRVIPARFRGVRSDTGGAAEGLFIEEVSNAAPGGSLRWRVMLKMKRAKAGVRVDLFSRVGGSSGVSLELIERSAEEGWIARVIVAGAGQQPGDLRAVLERVGLTPLPPYILAARKLRESNISDESDRAEYQTVYAHDASTSTQPDQNESAFGGAQHNSVAAPTAGLHFTPELMNTLRASGVNFAEVMLDVGLGTFKPVETEFVEQHAMHSEYCWVPADAAEAIAQTKSRGGRVIAVGTTAARTLESFAGLDDLRSRGPAGKHTRLLITPGWKWRVVDGLITNFHLPRTTLLAMVAAILEGQSGEGDEVSGQGIECAAGGRGVERMHIAYREAVRERYRFYSYGDATVII